VAHLEVDPAVLDDTANGLRHCANIAREFSDHRGRLRELLGDCGSHHLRDAAEHFVGRWGYGMGLIVGDAEQLAKQLQHAADEYRRLETEISRAAR
jgi:hypothetical protein